MGSTFWELYGSTVRLHRERRGWSQQELARWLGYSSKVSISEIESGTKIPGGEKMVEIARLFGVTVSSMLGEEVSPRSSEEAEMQQCVAAVLMLVPNHYARRRLLAHLLEQVSTALRGEHADALECADPTEGA